MSLGQRNAKAKHETLGVQKQSSVSSTNFQEHQRVITVDGYAGTVTAVYESPYGSEEYDVTLDGGMGGGQYTASQISPAPTAHEAVGVHLASDDYPVLTDILHDRPDIAAPSSKIASAFSPGQKILTFDGLSGTITACLGNGMSSFGGGMSSIYAVVLDNGLGGGEYAAGDLRPQFGGVTPVIHQADLTGQQDGGFEDVGDGDGSAEAHSDGGELQTGASLSATAADTKEKPWGEYKNPVSKGDSWKGEHQEFEPEHHPMARERHYPMGGGGDSDHSSNGNPVPEDVSKKYEPPHLTSLNSLDVLMYQADLAIEAAVNNSWGEPEPTDLQLAPKPFGATTPKDPKANPGATGWATHGDPDNWQGIGPGAMGSDGRYASLNDGFDEEMMFEAAGPAGDTTPAPDPYSGTSVSDNGDQNSYELAGGTLRGDDKAHALHGEQPVPAPIPAPDLGGPGYPSGPKGGQGAEMPPGAPGEPNKEPKDEGAEATLNDQPEGALPKTDGAAWSITADISMGEGDAEEEIPQDDQALTPSRTASLEDIVANFQRNASYLSGGGDDSDYPTEGTSDIAMMAKIALKDYSPGEQAAIINEGAHASAGNLNRLQLEGTHYADSNVKEEELWLT